MDRSKSQLYIFFFFNNLFHSDVRHNMEEKISCYFYYIVSDIKNLRNRFFLCLLFNNSAWQQIKKKCPQSWS